MAGEDKEVSRAKHGSEGHRETDGPGKDRN